MDGIGARRRGHVLRAGGWIARGWIAECHRKTPTKSEEVRKRSGIHQLISQGNRFWPQLVAAELGPCPSELKFQTEFHCERASPKSLLAHPTANTRIPIWVPPETNFFSAALLPSRPHGGLLMENSRSQLHRHREYQQDRCAQSAHHGEWNDVLGIVSHWTPHSSFILKRPLTAARFDGTRNIFGAPLWAPIVGRPGTRNRFWNTALQAAVGVRNLFSDAAQGLSVLRRRVSEMRHDGDRSGEEVVSPANGTRLG
jgi:hypothetical protein